MKLVEDSAVVVKTTEKPWSMMVAVEQGSAQVMVAATAGAAMPLKVDCC